MCALVSDPAWDGVIPGQQTRPHRPGQARCHTTNRFRLRLAGRAAAAALCTSTPAVAPSAAPSAAAAAPVVFSGADTAWMLLSTVLVLLMTMPGIILFYGGMLRT